MPVSSSALPRPPPEPSPLPFPVPCSHTAKRPTPVPNLYRCNLKACGTSGCWGCGGWRRNSRKVAAASAAHLGVDVAAPAAAPTLASPTRLLPPLQLCRPRRLSPSAASPSPHHSVHSWLGLALLALLAAQYCVGAFAYLTPQLSPAGKRALGPVHRFLGLATFTAGLATMAAGLQEKATFVQAFGMPSSLRAPVLVLPALIAVLLLLTGLAVLAHHAPLPPPPPHHRQASEEEALVTPGGPVTVDSEIEIEDRHSA